MKSVGVSEFKAKCTKFLADVVEKGEPVVITRRGRRVAEVRRLVDESPGREDLRGSVSYHGSVLDPIGERWEAEPKLIRPRKS